MNTRDHNEVLALAAVYQAITEVRAVAEKGLWNPEIAKTCLAGLLEPFAGDIAETFGGADKLAPGLEQLHSQLTAPQDMDQTRYVVMVLHLERKLIKRQAMLQVLGDGLAQVRRQVEYFGESNDTVITRLADLYSQTVSQLKPNIIVRGQRDWLNDPHNAHRVRALLLAAIRAATLWRASGGNRFRLILGRNRLASNSKTLIERLSWRRTAEKQTH